LDEFATRELAQNLSVSEPSFNGQKSKEVFDHASLYARNDHHHSNPPLAARLASLSCRKPDPPAPSRDLGCRGDQVPARPKPTVTGRKTSRLSHHFDASLSNQFDEWIWFDETRAVRPLTTQQSATHEPQHPFAIIDE
jgi:hypothetical protein